MPLTAGDFLPGPASLTSALAPLLGSEHALLTCSGTAALVVALTALRARSCRREVLIPAYTCPLVPIAVAHCGLKPRLCDVRADHFEMEPLALQALCGDRTLAVIPAHLGGRLADIRGVTRIAHAAGALVIEDAAQALGAIHSDGTPACMAGDIGLTSLAAGKGLTIYEGGLLVTRHDDLLPALKHTACELLPQRMGWEIRRCAELLGYAALYRPRSLHLVYGRPLRKELERGDPVSAVGDRFAFDLPLHRVGRWRQAVGARAARRLPHFLSALRCQAKARLSILNAIPGIRAFEDRGDEQGTWPCFLLTLPDMVRRDAALDRLWRAGVGVSRLFIHALSDYDYLRPLLAGSNTETAEARAFAARSLTVTNSQWLDEATFALVVGVLDAICLDS